jgi:hypothetical protein
MREVCNKELAEPISSPLPGDMDSTAKNDSSKDGVKSKQANRSSNQVSAKSEKSETGKRVAERVRFPRLEHCQSAFHHFYQATYLDKPPPHPRIRVNIKKRQIEISLRSPSLSSPI